LGVGGTPLVTMYLHKTNVFFEKFNGKDYLWLTDVSLRD
jgi:hypothetical protein